MDLLPLALANLNPDLVRRVLSGEDRELDRPLRPANRERLAAAGIDFLTRHCDGFPAWLAALPDAPPWLFNRGVIPSRPGVAVVGSRRATQYGIEVAAEIGRLVAVAGWPVVSGLAAGVDGAAHEGALEGRGTALAVLGSGIDVWYPARHRRLGEQILASGGAVVSEFGPGCPPDGWRFPFRNRIVSGLSSVVIVVEAAVRSGALITAHTALAQGREVVAVPGDITRATSAGTNLLIRDGAHPLTALDELIPTLELLVGPAPAGDSPGECVVPGRLVPLDEWLVEGGRSPVEGMAVLGRLQAAGRLEVAEGMVRERG
jgi:DNA processing protein